MTTKAEKDWAGHEFVMVREFAAPRELVFQAWTDPKHLATARVYEPGLRMGCAAGREDL